LDDSYRPPRFFQCVFRCLSARRTNMDERGRRSVLPNVAAWRSALPTEIQSEASRRLSNLGAGPTERDDDTSQPSVSLVLILDDSYRPHQIIYRCFLRCDCADERRWAHENAVSFVQMMPLEDNLGPNSEPSRRLSNPVAGPTTKARRQYSPTISFRAFYYWTIFTAPCYFLCRRTETDRRGWCFLRSIDDGDCDSCRL